MTALHEVPVPFFNRLLRTPRPRQQVGDEHGHIRQGHAVHAVDVGAEARPATDDAADEGRDVGPVAVAVGVHVAQAGALRHGPGPEAAGQLEVAALQYSRVGLADGAFEFEVAAGAVPSISARRAEMARRST